MKILFYLYRLLSVWKHTLLVSVFGYTSYCKHTPSCAEYTLIQTQNHGTITGLWKGFQRLLTCW